MTRMDAKAMPTKDTDYSCDIKATELMVYINITPLVINSLGDRHIRHTYANTHAQRHLLRNIFNKQGAPDLNTLVVKNFGE